MSRKPIQIIYALGGRTTDIGSLPTGSWRNFKPIIDYDVCTQCWTCIDYCPEGVIAKTDDGPKIDYDFCKGCGVCSSECPVQAIHMEPEG